MTGPSPFYTRATHVITPLIGTVCFNIMYGNADWIIARNIGYNIA